MLLAVKGRWAGSAVAEGRVGGVGRLGGGIRSEGNQPNSAAGGGEGTPLVSVMSGQRRRRAGGLE